jgi:hypothetical protein
MTTGSYFRYPIWARRSCARRQTKRDPGNGIGGAKADAADVPRQSIGILGDELGGVGTVGSEDSHRTGCSNAVSVQEDHDLADGSLVRPASNDGFRSLSCVGKGQIGSSASVVADCTQSRRRWGRMCQLDLQGQARFFIVQNCAHRGPLRCGHRWSLAGQTDSRKSSDRRRIDELTFSPVPSLDHNL